MRYAVTIAFSACIGIIFGLEAGSFVSWLAVAAFALYCVRIAIEYIGPTAPRR